MARCSSWGHTESDTTQGLSNSNNKEWTGSPTGTWKVALFPLHRDAAVFLVWILNEEAHPNLSAPPTTTLLFTLIISKFA